MALILQHSRLAALGDAALENRTGQPYGSEFVYYRSNKNLVRKESKQKKKSEKHGE